MYKYSLVLFVSAAIIVGQWQHCSGIPNPAEEDKKINFEILGLTDGDSLPSLPYLSLATLLKCFALDNVIDTVESYMTAGLLKGGSLAKIQLISYFDIIHQGVADALKGGLVGNGQYLCDQYTANATVGKFNCLLNGEQSFLEDELANGYQTILCGELSKNYVQFLDGYIQMYMSNSLDVPFNGSINFGPILGTAKGVISKEGISMKLTRVGGIDLQF